MGDTTLSSDVYISDDEDYETQLSPPLGVMTPLVAGSPLHQRLVPQPTSVPLGQPIHVPPRINDVKMKYVLTYCIYSNNTPYSNSTPTKSLIIVPQSPDFRSVRFQFSCSLHQSQVPQLKLVVIFMTILTYYRRTRRITTRDHTPHKSLEMWCPCQPSGPADGACRYAASVIFSATN